MTTANRSRKKKTPQDYLQLPYARLLIPNGDGSFSAEILEFTGCFAQGETAEEAIRNVNASAAEWIDAAMGSGREIPEPFTTRGYSGTISLRLPKAIHRQASRLAERDGVSLNQYLLTAIAARVGADDLLNRIVQRWQQAQVQINAAVMLFPSGQASTDRSLAAAIEVHGDASSALTSSLQAPVMVSAETR